MLEMMRSHKFFSVFLLSAITFMIIISFVFWGIGPKDNAAVQHVAQVGNERIMLQEYYRTYDNEYKRLKGQYSDEEIKKMNLQDRVIESLIDRRVLLIAAKNAGITVTEAELQREVMNTKFFQRNGAFDVEVYKRALKLNRMTPQEFEAGVRNDMIAARMSRLIAETVELTPEEKNMLDSITGDNKAQLAQIFLSSKSSQNIKAYVESLKKQISVSVNKDIVL